MAHTDNAKQKRSTWDLSWESPNYVKLSEIKAEENKTSFVAEFESDKKAKKAISLMKGWFGKNGYGVKSETRGSMPYLTFKRKSSTVLLGQGKVSGSVLALCDTDEVDTVSHLLWPFRTMQEYGLQSLGELKHGKTPTTIPSSKIRAYCSIGIPTESEEPAFLDPCTFYEFRLGRQLVGKAYFSYYDYEMDECAPTIEMFEVKKKSRRKGIGSKMYQFVEKVTSDQGFDRILVTDIRTSEFWSAMGFEVDLDEAVKYLCE
ncbi:MAG: GNAT family N-acetyltransferase [Rhabdochlamydiaceae bacterium]